MANKSNQASKLVVSARSVFGIAFDLEGTIVDVETIHYQAHILTARDIGVNLVSLNLSELVKLIPSFVGGPREAVAREILQLSDGSHDLEFVTRQNEIHYQQLLETAIITPRQGFTDFLEKIHELGIETAIGSVTPREEAEILFQASGLNAVFPPERIVLQEDVLRPKPHPDVFLETSSRMRINPVNQLVFGDSMNDARAAREIDSLFIAMPVYFDDPIFIEQFRKEGAIRVYKSWVDLDISDLG